MKNVKEKEYARTCLETKHGITVEIGNLTYEDAKSIIIRGCENGEFYDIDYFTWNGEEIKIYH